MARRSRTPPPLSSRVRAQRARGTSAGPRSLLLASLRVGTTTSRIPRRHDERPTIATAVHTGVIHLLGVCRRADERARRRRTCEIRRRIHARPKQRRRVDDAIIADLAVIERRPPARVPRTVCPTSLVLLLL